MNPTIFIHIIIFYIHLFLSRNKFLEYNRFFNSCYQPLDIRIQLCRYIILYINTLNWSWNRIDIRYASRLHMVTFNVYLQLLFAFSNGIDKTNNTFAFNIKHVKVRHPESNYLWYRFIHLFKFNALLHYIKLYGIVNSIHYRVYQRVLEYSSIAR